ncbi:MAG TPA: type IV pilus modification protein PilV [Steroidobacter sp.]|uniref:type IV pilus modification protein PilV n=1 Tax=Steroidobacter sp. TaxID=1978227 RepID=UPI002ED909D1
MSSSIAGAQRGTTLIEVLVTVLIVSIGLLGLAGLQQRMLLSEMESYQRVQALLLLNDMASRIVVNRASAAEYVTDEPLGAGMSCPTDPATRPEIDAAEWCQALQGAAEVTTTESNVGAMVGGRGCVEQLPNNEYMITVAWQGLGPVSAPPSSVACGQGEYDDDGESDCSQDRCRRAVTTVVRIASLSAPP